jgi:hypothetical protein
MYCPATADEQAKVSFPTELENELFKQIVVSGQELSHTKRELSRTRDELNRREYDLDCVHASASYRIGRAVTWLPRKVRGVVRSFKEHGLPYTLNRRLLHLHLPKG